MKKYISDVVGDEFENWMLNQFVFIEAPTGSGKTTFILEKLVEFAALKGRKILYLVNRTILKKQLEEKIDTDIKVNLRKFDDDEFNENLKNVIDIKMYQQIEEECKKNPQELENSETEYKYIIADECHYFLADSTFNTYTQLSFDWIMAKRKNVNTVFISATPGRFKELILQDKRIHYEDEKLTEPTEINTNNMEVQILHEDMEFCTNVAERIKTYQVDSDYSYINPFALKDTDDIVQTIKEEKGKWIVFVDSIKRGEEIQSSLEKNEVKAIFMDSLLKDHDYNVRETIKEISKIECFSEQVLIATAVMDNGISIKDTKVRNLIIMADTYEEFLQMLGRKRMLNEEDTLNVYFLKRSSGDFARKLKDVNEELKFITRHQEMPSISLYEMVESESCYYGVRRAYYLLEYLIKLNKFAFEQYRYLKRQYNKIIGRFKEEDSSAFIREQMKWLGKGSEEIEKLVKEESERLYERITKILEEYTGKKLTKEQNIELRDSIRGDLKEFLTIKTDGDEQLKEKYRMEINELGKTGKPKSDDSSAKPRPLTADKFNKIATFLELKFKMKELKESDTYCMITKIDSQK